MPDNNLAAPSTDLRAFLNILHRRLWIVAAFFVVLVTLVTVATVVQDPVYRATATLLIDKESARVLSFRDVVTLGAESHEYREYYETQLKILRSVSLAEKVVGMLGTPPEPSVPSSRQTHAAGFCPPGTQAAQGPRRVNASPPTPPEHADALLKRIMVDPERNSRLVRVSAESQSPERAAHIANTWVRAYVTENLARKIRAAEGASEWILVELDQLKERLEASERQLDVYKKKTGIISLERNQDIVVRRLAELNTALTDAETELFSAESLYRQVTALETDSTLAESLSLVRDNLLIQELKRDTARVRAEFNRTAAKLRPEHPEMVRLASQLEEMENVIQHEVSRIADSLRSEYKAAQDRVASLREALADQTRKVQELNEKSIEYRILSREAKTNNRLYNTLLTRLKEVKLSAGMHENNVSVLDSARPPDAPVRPKKMLNILLACMAGLTVGVGLAFVTEHLDTSIKTAEDVHALVDTPLLGNVPTIRLRGTAEKDQVALKERHSGAGEAYRNLRTNLRFLSPDRPLKTILVTSTSPQEGKTLTACNLGISLALAGNRTLLVDADLRRPSMHRTFNVDNSRSLTKFLVNGTLFDPLVQETGVENLSVVPSGKHPPNPAELLDSDRMREFLAEAATHFDYVLVDSPPLLGLSDSIILSSMVDGAIQVIRSGKTTSAACCQAHQMLYNAGANVLGTVLNDINVQKNGYYYYYSHKYYTSPEA